MAYDELAADRVRLALKGRRGVTEKKMFGGLAFMLRGHLCCGIVADELMLRVGPDRYGELLEAPHVRPMDFTGKPLRGFLYIEPKGFATAAGLARWIDIAAGFVRTLPAK